MQNSSLTSELNRVISDGRIPEDDRDNHLHPDHLYFTSEMGPQEAFSDLVETMTDHVLPATRKSKREDYRACGEQLLLNLSRCSLARSWLLISGNSSHYKAEANGEFPRVFTSYRMVHLWLRYLLENDLLEFKQGKKYKENPVLNRYYPKQDFLRQLIKFALHIESPIRPPYLRLSKPNEAFIGYDWEEKYGNQKLLNQYNNFAKTQSWALKAPIVQIFTYTHNSNGRLHTPFQNLPSRSYSIRINTQINGNPIAEVDFNANHLRLFLAKKGLPYDGDDPYKVIAKEAGVERWEVKGFTTIAFNCESFSKALGAAFGRRGVHPAKSKKIHQALESIYPNLNFFSGFGIDAMNKEGEILMNVIAKGMDAGIFCLPIHDAIAVEAQHAEWAKEAMLQAWSEEVNDGIWCIHNATTVVDIKYGDSK